MITIEGVTGWTITQVDQSVAAAGFRNSRPLQLRGVRIMAQAHGPRYERWKETVSAGDYANGGGIEVVACVYAPTFESAMVALQDAITRIEATNPY